MKHAAVDQVLARANTAKEDSDFTYFFTLLFCAEALAKLVVLSIVASIGDDKDRNRYRLEHSLVRADGIGEWSRVLEDALVGLASQHLLADARVEQCELTQLSRAGDWQYDCVLSLREALVEAGIYCEEIPVKTDMRRWFRLFAALRNGTRGHGATSQEKAGKAAVKLFKSLQIFYTNFGIFKRSWAYLHRNLAGHYRVSPISETAIPFLHLKKETNHSLPNGVYIHLGTLRQLPLLQCDPELRDFLFANGGFSGKRFELLSYYTDNKAHGDATAYLAPAGSLPQSETEGSGELLAMGNCFSNVPALITDYVARPKLEERLYQLIADDKRPIVTLVGRGGIGKTSLALRVIPQLYPEKRFQTIVWLSARDVDLQLSGPKAVRPKVTTPEDMGKLYARMVLPRESCEAKGFVARMFFEQQLQKCDLGPTLFVFDNFETTQNPIEMFNWIESFIRLPNKALITTRLRDFKGDYPLEVQGMDRNEAETLIERTAAHLGVAELLTKSYAEELISQSEGHPYVIKILLGEVAKEGRAANIPRIVAGSDDILTALFERTYAILSPCAQRAFQTLSAWASSVPRLALEAVLLKSTGERQEVERGIESLVQYSIAEVHVAPADKQEFISLPLVASVFGRKKLNVSPFKVDIQADVEILQMLRPRKPQDVHLGLGSRIENFIVNISRKINADAAFAEYASILAMICRSYNPGWLVLARWHMEMRSDDGYKQASEELRTFLGNDPYGPDAADAWKMLGHACYQTGDKLGEIHAFVERAQIADIPFHEVSNTANRLNELLRNHGVIDREQKRALAMRLASVLERRIKEAEADDYSRMAWLSIHLGQDTKAQEYAEAGLCLDPTNHHCRKIKSHTGGPI